MQKQKSPNNIIGGICVCVDPNSSFFFFSASVSGVGKRKEVLEKRRGEELLPKKEDNFQVDDTTGVGKSRVANMEA